MGKRDMHAGGVNRKRKGRTENCEDFGRVLGMNMKDLQMGLRGEIDDRLMERIKKIDVGPEIEEIGARHQKPKGLGL